MNACGRENRREPGKLGEVSMCKANLKGVKERGREVGWGFLDQFAVVGKFGKAHSGHQGDPRGPRNMALCPAALCHWLGAAAGSANPALPRNIAIDFRAQQVTPPHPDPLPPSPHQLSPLKWRVCRCILTATLPDLAVFVPT